MLTGCPMRELGVSYKNTRFAFCVWKIRKNLLEIYWNPSVWRLWRSPIRVIWGGPWNHEIAIEGEFFLKHVFQGSKHTKQSALRCLRVWCLANNRWKKVGVKEKSKRNTEFSVGNSFSDGFMFHSSWPNVWLLDVLMLSEADVMPWSLHQEHRGVWLNRGWLGCGCNKSRKRMMRRSTRMNIRMMRTRMRRTMMMMMMMNLIIPIWLWWLWGGGGGGGEFSTNFPLRNGG